MSKLPDTLSELLSVALDDLEATERDPRYVIDMDDWHCPEAGKCAVCLAGAVMAKTFDADPERYLVPGEVTGDDSRELRALDALRGGYVQDAANLLGLDVDLGEFEYVEVTTYESDATAFKQELRHLAHDLKEAGL